MRCTDYNIKIGCMERGERNLISDVSGVTVGHCTVDSDIYKTGVSVVMPCKNNPYLSKLPAASYVLNGYGKSAGLIQIDELGTVETPIALTSTLNVGAVHDAMVDYMKQRTASDGGAFCSLNPIVCECNDSRMSKNTDKPVFREHVFAAINDARADFALGSVGAGRGMICYGLKGGVGSSSRIVRLGAERYTLGVLVLTNHGELRDLTVCGECIGGKITSGAQTPDRGSVIVLVATDAPLSDRQIGRVLRRAAVGIIRTGSHLGHGSGDILVGFSTAEANRTAEGDTRPVRMCMSLNESCIDELFRAAAEATEEAVLDSMLASDSLAGFDGGVVPSLNGYGALFDKR